MDAVVDAINRFALEGEAKAGQSIGIIASEETKDRYPKGIVKCIGSRAEEEHCPSSLSGAPGV